MERILIIGASGLLGSGMLSAYAPSYRVFGTYNEHKPSKENMHGLDVTQKTSVAKLVKELSPDLVIDAHGISSVEYCEEHHKEAWRVNVEGTKNVAEAAKEAGSAFVYISTNGVFDGEKRTPYTENDKPNPVYYYGITKLEAESATESIIPNRIIARTSWLFGRGGSRKIKQFANWVLESLKAGQRISVMNDYYGNPTFTSNLADFVIKLYKKNASGIFHTAGKDIVSRFEFAQKLANEFDLEKSLIIPTTAAEVNRRAKTPLRIGLDISKAEKATGVKGMRIEDAIHSFRMSLQTSASI